MNVQIVFQCRFIIRRGCSHSWLRAGSVMEVRGSFFDVAAATGARPFPRVRVSRKGANACLWSQLPSLRRVLLQQPWQGCGGQGGDVTVGLSCPNLWRQQGQKHHLPAQALSVVFIRNRSCFMCLVSLIPHVTKVTLPALLESLELDWLQLYLEM